MEGCLARHLAAKRKTQTQERLEKHEPIEQAPRVAKRSPKVEHLQQAYREERLAYYEQIVALHEQGMSQARIAEQVGVSDKTVGRWLTASGPAETRRGPYVSQLDPYLPFLFQRWQADCHNMVRLHQELVSQGFKGSYASVRDHIIRRLPEGKKNGANSSELARTLLTSRQATFLFLARPE
ncbi:MAG: helix-turn-helix domain-containing protein [Ktedonobacteraceae bacterium]